MPGTESPIIALTELAEAAYALSDPVAHPETIPAVWGGPTGRPERWQLVSIATRLCGQQLSRAIEVLTKSSDLAIFNRSDEGIDPALVYPGGSFRAPFEEFVISLLSSAAQRFYYLRQEMTAMSFVRTVIENYEEMTNIALGEPMRGHALVGFTGIEIADGDQIAMPWGTLRPTPKDFQIGFGVNSTTAILAIPCICKVRISKEPYPIQLAPHDVITPYVTRARIVIPLAFALATGRETRCAPMPTFDTTLLPIMETNSFRSPESYLPAQPMKSPSLLELRRAEEWAQRLEENQSDSLQIAQGRIVSAIAQRTDKADALIDALIAWESLVGTRTETVFRVTAALARLLESGYPGRTALRKSLGKVYDVRSRVVHGDSVRDEDIRSAADEAIDIGLRTLKILYERSDDWLVMNSSERADRLILEN
jgi:hypothetical protein